MIILKLAFGLMCILPGAISQEVAGQQRIDTKYSYRDLMPGISVLLASAIFGCCSAVFCHCYKRRYSLKESYHLYLSSLIAGTTFGLVILQLLPELPESNYGMTINEEFNCLYVIICLGFLLSMIVDRACITALADSDYVLEAEQDKVAILDIETLYRTQDPSTEIINHSKNYKTTYSVLTVLISTVFVGIHSIYEGFVVATLGSWQELLAGSVAIAGHKWAVGFALISYYIQKEINAYLIGFAAVFFTVSSPIGILLGKNTVENGSPAVVGILTAIAIGAILYFSMELLFDSVLKNIEANQKKTQYISYAWFTVGILMIFAVTAIFAKL